MSSSHSLIVKRVSFALVGALFLLVPFAASAQAICPSLYRNLSQGMSGSDVTQLQQFLIAQRHLASGNATGYFGPLTEAAVKSFQSANGIVSNGSPQTTGYGAVGPKTRAVIAQKCSGTPPPTPPPQVGFFSVTPTSGTAPLSVTFGAQGTGPYQIDFGDGQSASMQVTTGTTYPPEWRATHTYTSADTYTARLKIGGTVLAPVTIRVSGQANEPSIEFDAPTAGKTVKRGDAMNVEWDSSNAPSGSKVRLEVYPSNVSLTTGNNDRGLASNSSELSRDGSYNWTIPPSALTGPCIVDAGYTSCLAAGAYKLIAKLYSGSACWGYCVGSTDRTIHATAVSELFTISDATTTAAFSATPTSGAAPLSVEFSTWLPGNRPATPSYTIEFGDGATTTPANCTAPTDQCTAPGKNAHQYSTAGTYTAKLIESDVSTPLGTVAITVTGGSGLCTAPTRDLGTGDTDASKGGDVTRLQQFLKRDVAIYPEGLVTGYFGHATERAVKRFQARESIPQTGFVGPLTRAAIKAICGGGTPTRYSFSASPASGAAPLAVSFTANPASTTDDNIWYSIEFGDGSTENMSSDVDGGTLRVSHTYQSAGTFAAKLKENESLCGIIGENIYGCTSSLEIDSTTVTVTGSTTPPPPPPPPPPGCTPGFDSLGGGANTTCDFECPVGYSLVGRGYCAPLGQPAGTVAPTPNTSQCYQGQVLLGGQCVDTCNQGTIYSGGRCMTLQEFQNPPIPWWYNSAGGNALSAMEAALRGLSEWLAKQPQ